ncbi:ABC transporter substrate-binding protein [Chelatococcus asaccharovorans]|uniref:Putative spermidine/putrescine transport system substrate-binding protein n=1 Tax=Chelatococcus asaccharovorans TaxID=28210 RepID=A0A2V3U4K2_9HYPH|nr:extracellular solute-binding protein [Chelatococcus asaccharovorans]MBS7703712.1 extracellular solute-binding protein [Chelatococcus asaccharovorans]PXW57870.1 putative spermidine/putrescine transport system substrate-binding protein [Chelatococcus asaccharovorans]
MTTRLSRRQALALLGSAAGTSMLPKSSLAASGKVTVGTWGGAFQDVLTSSVSPILAKDQIEIVFDIAMQGERKTKLLAEKRLRTGSLDIVLLADNDMYEMNLAGVLAPLPADRIPQLEKLFPEFRNSYSVPQISSGLVIIYRSDRVAAAPKSYADLWTSKFAGKLGIADTLFVQNIIVASQVAAAGGPIDYEAGKKKLLELKASGVKIYPGVDQLAQGMKSGEVTTTIMWRARAAQWKDAGIPVDNVGATEGILPVTFEIGIPANAPNLSRSIAFIKSALSPEAQVAFAKQFGYAPTVSDSGISQEMLDKLGFTDQERAHYFKPDIKQIAELTPAWSDWWQTVFLA